MSEVTLHEVVRRLDKIEQILNTQDEQHIERREYEAHWKSQAERDKTHHRRLERLEAGQQWMLRGLAGAFVMVLLEMAVIVMTVLA